MDFKYFNQTVFNNFLSTIQIKDSIKYIYTEFSNSKNKYLINKDYLINIGKFNSQTILKLFNLLITILLEFLIF